MKKNVYDGLHWNIYDVLPFQRCFNFINGPRTTGKTYTMLFFFLVQAIYKEDREFIYLCRTKDEKESGIFESTFSKVIREQAKTENIVFTKEECRILYEDGSEKMLGYCFALSEYKKIKKRAFPKVKYIGMDEYMLEDDGRSKREYVNGWKEPDLFLNIYQSVDRDEDRVICFLLGNNTKFHNPYHMHPAFNIKPVQPGEYYLSENVLFTIVKTSDKLKEIKDNTKFARMINNTEYGRYANNGEYIYDNNNFVEPIKGLTKYKITLRYLGESFGVFQGLETGHIYVSDSVNDECLHIYAFTSADHNIESLLVKNNPLIKWLGKQYLAGNVRFTSEKVKIKIEPAIIALC